VERLQLIRELVQDSAAKIVFLILDGLGGLPGPGGQTELEAARTPNLDTLAGRSTCGLIDPVSPGITPGSGPSHLALFGYDPFQYQVGRGVLEALGIDFDLRPSDVAARGNFCTVDERGLLVDRRAGRIESGKAAELCRLLGKIKLEGVEVLVEPVKEHRFVVVLRGEGLSSEIADTDPQQTGVAPLPPQPLSPAAQPTAALAEEFIHQARALLDNHHPANMIMLRGFSQYPKLPLMGEVYGLRAAAIARYPMYRGLAKLVGMEVLAAGNSLEEQIRTLSTHYSSFDFFYLHVKDTDRAGEDGDFQAKVQAIEEVDRHLPQLLALEPEVLVVTGDHSTPAALASHSWHPVPFLLHSRWCRPDGRSEFSERACRLGGLGRFPAAEIMALALANARKLTKYGA
jgi:2,3-bisphosphoglycerate-independent phosphoglycerate mutase